MKITKQKAQHSLKMFMSKDKRFTKDSPKAKYVNLRKEWEIAEFYWPSHRNHG